MIYQDVGEPPTLHRLQILQRFQPEKAKPFSVLPNGFLLDGLTFRLP